MIGMIAAAVYIIDLPEIGSVTQLIEHPNVASKINFFPDFNDPNLWIPLIFIPLAVQWWSAWYPGAEPGGGGYVAQRMLSARDEKDAIKATLFFNAAHYALRPWPWILIALASLIIFPDMESIRSSFPGIDESIINDDLAFPAMLTLLPKGLLGLVIAALTAALMSTISTHLNWGSSYLVHDFYRRFINDTASEKDQVRIGRVSTMILMILAAILALFLTNALQAFNILLQIGAGTGLLFLLRWFWWRINAYSEIAAMIVSFAMAIYFELIYKGDLASYEKMCIAVAITTVVWLGVTLMTRPTEINTLKKFYAKIQPSGSGWQPVISLMDKSELSLKKTRLSQEILMMFLGCILIYAAMFSIGHLLYGNWLAFGLALLVGLVSLIMLRRLWDQ